MAGKLPKMRVLYYDEARTPDTIIVGQWELVQAERKFGTGAVTERRDLDAITFACYLGARRAGIIADGTAYEAWAQDVAVTEEMEPGESQAPLAT
jgi:hypothetical protein